MAKQKAVKETPVKAEKGTPEFTFTCRFCGEAKPFDEMVIQTRYFPVLTSCRACDKALQNLKLEELPEETEDTAAKVETDGEEASETEEKPE